MAAKKPKDAGPQLWTTNALARELKRDRAALTKALADLTPAQVTSQGAKGGQVRSYYLADVVNHLVTGGNLKARGDKETAEARWKSAKAEVAEMELAALKRDLVPAQDVRDVVARLFHAVKQRVLTVPTRLAPRVVNAKTAPRARELMKGSLQECLLDLATTDLDRLLEAKAAARAKKKGRT